MNVFIISPSYDTGGQAARIASAFGRHAPDWSVRSMCLKTDWIRFPADLEWDEVRGGRLYNEADVVHHQNGLGMYLHYDRGQQKPTVLHHQGSRLRTNPRGVHSEGLSVGATQIVSTVDLLEDCPGAAWLPAPCQVDYVASFRKRYPNRPLRIGHAPTNRRAKNTEGILQILDKLSKKCDFELDLIEQIEWKACLSRKGRCDIIIDQVTLGYGNNAIEAMAMGIPVVSGWAESGDRQRFIDYAGTLPQFVEATIETLEEKLEPLIRSSELREEWGRRGRDYVQMFHEESRTVKRLKEIYTTTPPSNGSVHIFNPARERMVSNG